MPLDEGITASIQRRVLESRLHRAEHLERMRERQRQGMQVARQGAQLLKEYFGVTRVVLFGSLLDAEHMWWGSDIDLAVWGLPDALLLQAGAMLERHHDFSVDLVQVQQAKPHILQAIAQGLEL